MRILLLAIGLLGLAACDVPPPVTTTPPPVVSNIPGSDQVCATISTTNLDLAWKGYDAALDAINLMIDAKAVTPGSAKAKAIAGANDRVLAAFKTAEAARAVCNAASYQAALAAAGSALVNLRAALRSN